jgi:type IV secretory pathway TraG/TraD family ATPase VirD4
MAATIHALMHGDGRLALGYAVVLAGLMAGLLRGRAAWSGLLTSPLVALPLTLLASALAAIAGAALGGLGGERAGALQAAGVLQTGMGAIVFAAVGYTAGRVLAARRWPSAARHRRGAIVTDGRCRRRSVRLLTLAGLPVAPADETKHFKLIGTTGTGKSTAICELLRAALARGDRAVIADPDAGYVARFHDAARGDVILNPFDPSAHKWDLCGEIHNDYDAEQLAHSLIPDSQADRSWQDYARTFFTAVTQQAMKAGARDDAELYRLLTSAPIEELRRLLPGTAAGPFLEAGNERMFGSVRSIASSAVRVLQYTTRQQAAAFSVREWVREGAARAAGGAGGVLFLPYRAGQIAALRSAISGWMRLAIFEAMDREEGDQRLWFVVDELDALGEIDGLKDALARLRKFGGRCVLGLQSIAQVSATYGRGVADTIVENCGNTLILRCSASEHGGTAQFVSGLIGMREVIHTVRSHTRGSAHRGRSTTISEQVQTEPAVMASEIERLADLEGFLKLTSAPDWRRVKLTPAPGPARTRGIAAGADAAGAQAAGWR